MCKSACCEEDGKKATFVFQRYKDRPTCCTDLLFFAAFCALWVVVLSLLAATIEEGDPYKLVYGVDHKGRICGVDDGVEELELAMWPSYQEYEIKKCVASCDETQSSTYMVSTYTSKKFTKYCIPWELNGGVSVSLSGDFDSYASAATQAIGDLWTCWATILVSPLGSMILAYMFLTFLEYCTKCLVWVVLICMMSGGGMGSAVLLSYAYDYAGTNTGTRADALMGLGYTCAVLSAVFVLIILVLRKQINIAAEVIAQSASAIADMKAIPFFPLFPLFLGLCYFAFWIVGALYIFSVSDPTTKDLPTLASGSWPAVYGNTYVDYEWDDGLQGSFAVHFFHLLWNMQFLIYFTYFVIAGAISQWYFAGWEDDSQKEKKRGNGYGELPNWPVCASCERATRFHLGTIACGALIIAIIQFMRACIAYIQSKVENADNKVAKFVLRCISCCLWCVECCMDKISKNALIWSAIYGDGFCVSACSSFKLVIGNMATTAAVTMVETFVLFLGKLCVGIFTGAIGAVVCDKIYGDDLSSIAMPGVVMFFIGFLVASLFFSSFETAIDTVFICFLVDEENSKSTGNPMRGPKDLVECVQSIKKTATDDHEETKTQE